MSLRLNGRLLKDARARMGLDANQVAKAILRPPSTISNAENGKSILNSTAREICEFLRLDLAKTIQKAKRRGRRARAA